MYQADSDSPTNSLLLRLINQNQSMNVSDAQNANDAEKIENMDAVQLFAQTELDTSPSTEVPPEKKLSATHGYFRNPENFLNQPATK